MLEPSSEERSTLPPITAAYIEDLEAEIERLRAENVHLRASQQHIANRLHEEGLRLRDFLPETTHKGGLD